MKKNAPNISNRFLSALPWTLNLLFYGSVGWIIAISSLPTIPEAVFYMQKQFLAGNESFFTIQNPGLSFAIFEPHLPRRGSVSFLTDVQEQTLSEQFSAAQSQLAPLILNRAPVEDTAIVFCTQDAIALSRLQGSGYQATIPLGNGKWIAKKQP